MSGLELAANSRPSANSALGAAAETFELASRRVGSKSAEKTLTTLPALGEVSSESSAGRPHVPSLSNTWLSPSEKAAASFSGNDLLGERNPASPSMPPTLEGCKSFAGLSGSSATSARACGTDSTAKRTSSTSGRSTGEHLKQASIVERTDCGKLEYKLPALMVGVQRPRFGSIFALNCCKLLHSLWGACAPSSTCKRTRPRENMSAFGPASRGICQPSGAM
mmetsp:Transcript_30516/g.101473  ORF Transcript_30516/g.101473 Transcript_30516/m.101473 type:complete len:222 (+) Transcript_30516:764-1429(+)